jgi:hypothetical protein
MRNSLVLSAILMVGLGACGSSPGGGDNGQTGAGGDGGSTGAGGGTGNGGTTGAGGNVNTTGGGGARGTGGASGGGGARATGGTTGSGGAPDGGAGGAGARDAGAGGASGAGGAGAGGASGAGGAAGSTWLSGYTATMFGNHTSGDCNGVANFSDTTNISGATCTHQGVTLAAYMSGVANDSSFYGAPGDESSIWMGPACMCGTGDTENAAGMCARPPSCPMEADCGRCFEIKCDPNGTGMYSDGATRKGAMYCNANQTAVIEVIDACPHNHPSNTWWCTNQRKNHIDLSCSAMEAIAGTPADVGVWGWLNVQVRPVNCSVGLGAHAATN